MITLWNNDVVQIPADASVLWFAILKAWDSSRDVLNGAIKRHFRQWQHNSACCC